MKFSNTYNNSIRPTWYSVNAMPVIGVDCIAIPAGYDYIRGGNGVGYVENIKDISG